MPVEVASSDRPARANRGGRALGRMFSRQLVVGAAVAAALAGCANDDGPVGTATTSTTVPTSTTNDRYEFTPTTEAGVVRNIARETADKIGCEIVQEVAYEALPIRGGAAVRGVTCTIGDATLDVFERSSGTGGSLENIDKRVGTRPDEQGACGWLLVGESWFIVTNSRPAAVDAGEVLGGAVREILPVSPFVSYEVPGGCRPS